jgi:agmatinase
MSKKNVKVYSVPLSLSTTFRHTTHAAPQAIQSMMNQLDPSQPYALPSVELIWLPIQPKIQTLQTNYQSASQDIIKLFNANKPLTTAQQVTLQSINKETEACYQTIEADCTAALKKDPVIVCGGEHGCGLGYIKALSKQGQEFGILQIDAHMDCRTHYAEYTFSHASAITHYSPYATHITQVGIRDYAEEEQVFQSNSATTFSVFYDDQLHADLFKGNTWHAICEKIIESLPKNVVISLDIDGLCPSYCPDTGTPVPGGLSYNQCCYLLSMVAQQRQIIGAELVEVGEGTNEDTNAIIGARLLQVLGACVCPPPIKQN